MELEKLLENQKRYLECLEKARKKIIQEFLYERLRNTPEKIIELLPKNDHKEYIAYNKERNSSRYKYVMCTVNFKEDISIKVILKKIEKALAKTWVIQAMYCLEQRAEYGEDASGIHAHIKIWIREGKNPYKCKGELYNTFKGVVGNKLHVNMRYSNVEGCFEEYIKGYKKGKEKKRNMADKVWRKSLGLENVYRVCRNL